MIQKKKELVKAQSNIKKLLTSDVDISLIEISGTIAKQMETLIETLESELEDKKKRLAKEQLKTDNREDLVDSLLDFKYLYKKGNEEQQKIILNQLIEKVVVRDVDDFDIYLNLTEGSMSLLPRRI